MDASSYWGLSVRPCGACCTSSAQLCCMTCGNLYLCPTCDHSDHMRVPLCEVCERNPASISCRADAATLCATCDADIHSANPLASRHVRISVVPFVGNLSKRVPVGGSGTMFEDEDQRDEAEAATWLLAEPTREAKQEEVENKDCCGGTHMSVVSEFDWGVNDINKGLYSPVYQEPSGTYNSLTHSGSSSDTPVVPDTTLRISDPTNLSADREARLMRYREKRKSRRFGKTIRYASRKAYAETRPRIKGRFAKPEEAETEADEIYSSATAALITDSDYGVVPSFYD